MLLVKKQNNSSFTYDVTYLNSDQTHSAAVIISSNRRLSEHGEKSNSLTINRTVVFSSELQETSKIWNPFKIVTPEQSSSGKLCKEC